MTETPFGLELLKLPDKLIIGAGIVGIIAIGVYCSKKNKSASDYFEAGGKLPGWLVGVSLLATMVSSLGFLAVPGFAFEKNWLYLSQYITYFIPLGIVLLVIIPFYRRNHITTVYEYLERRFGSWARVYTALIGILTLTFYIGTVLYTISLPIEVATGWPIESIIVGLGLLIAIYTVAGGLEAVIWTDLIQGIALIIGALFVLPTICHLLPGGFMQIIEQGWKDGKMSMGNLDFSLAQKGFWTIFICSIFSTMLLYCSNQTFIQRYNAAKSLREAQKAAVIGTFTYVPVMFYFLFIGTALYVFYKQFPEPALASMKSEQVFPYFILSRIPMGITGLVLLGVLAASMSTLDSVLNAVAMIITGDLYRRLIRPDQTERHYMIFGKWTTAIAAAVMISLALILSANKSAALLDIFYVGNLICLAGFFGLIFTGFMTVRVNSRAAATSLIITILCVIVFLMIANTPVGDHVPAIKSHLPNVFWLGLLADLFMVTLSLILSCFIKQHCGNELKNLTLWTMEKGFLRA